MTDETTYETLYVRTQYDGKDYMSIEEIYFVDEEGDESSITTCADQGDDLWSWLTDQVEGRLKAHGIEYAHLVFDDDPGNMTFAYGRPV